MTLYKNKYRSESTRKTGWNYGDHAFYFITICTKNRVCHFGEIKDNKMHLSDIGKCAEKCWLSIPNHFPFVRLHANVIMPNHVHGIVEIAKRNVGAGTDRSADGGTDRGADGGTDRGADVDTQNFAYLPPSNHPITPPSNHPITPSSNHPINTTSTKKFNNPDRHIDRGYKNKFGPQSQNLASIIRGFKIGVTKFAKTVNPDWLWQRNYYDHIIRDNESFDRIEKYIFENPSKWNQDRFHL